MEKKTLGQKLGRVVQKATDQVVAEEQRAEKKLRAARDSTEDRIADKAADKVIEQQQAASVAEAQSDADRERELQLRTADLMEEQARLLRQQATNSVGSNPQNNPNPPITVARDLHAASTANAATVAQPVNTAGEPTAANRSSAAPS